MKQLSFSSTSKVIIALLLFFSFILTLTLFAISVFLLLNHYDDFCHLLLSKLGKPDKEAFFKESFLPKEKYKIIQIVFPVATLLSLFINFLLFRKRVVIQQKLTPVLIAINLTIIDQFAFLRSLKHVRLFFFTLLFLQFIFFTWCAFTFPISYDEAWTYLNFTNKSVLSSISYYPAPNNHVLFSILTNITNIAPISDPKIKMRMINILFSLISSFIFLKLLCKFYSAEVSILIVTAFAFTYPVALYSMQARGYGMLILFSLICIYSTLSYLHTPSRKQFIIYLLSIIAGFYTIPTFLYAFISLQIFICCHCFSNKKIDVFKNLFIANCIGGCAVIILYTPIIFITGLKAITDNSYVKSSSITQVVHNLPEHFNYSLNWLFGLNQGGVLLVVLIILSLLFIQIGTKKSSDLKTACLCMLLFILLPPFILLAQRVIPFERTWTYLTIPFFFGLGSLLTILLEYAKNIHFSNKFILPVALISISLSLLSFFPSNYKEKHPLDYQAEELFTLNHIHNVHTVASNEILLTDLLTYKISVLNKDIPIKIVGIDASTKVYADAIILNNDLIIHIKNLNDYTFIGKNEYIQLYLKKTILNE